MKRVFYCVLNIIQKDNPNSQLLKKACEQRGIVFREIIVPETAYGLDQVPTLSDGGIYRLTTTKRGAQYVYALRLKNPRLKTWSDPSTHSIGSIPWSGTMLGEHIGMPVIPTLYGLSKEVDDALVGQINEHLGGFPVIIKRTGGSHGSGVLIVDSPISLKTVAAHMISDQASPQYVLRKYIHNARHFRVVVVNHECVSAIEYALPSDDIRTNAGKPDVRRAVLTDKLRTTALAAVRSTGTGLLFGGVDILIDESGTAYIAEVNTPCNFSRNQLCTGDDIAGKIVEFLCTD